MSTNFTLIIYRSFGKNFAIQSANPASAWGSAINILKQVEMIEGTPPDVIASWDIKTGHFEKATPFSDPAPPLPTQLAEIAKNPVAREYPIGHGNSYQIFIRRGFCPKSQSTLILAEKDALYYLNNSDESIPTKQAV